MITRVAAAHFASRRQPADDVFAIYVGLPVEAWQHRNIRILHHSFLCLSCRRSMWVSAFADFCITASERIMHAPVPVAMPRKASRDVSLLPGRGFTRRARVRRAELFASSHGRFHDKRLIFDDQRRSCRATGLSGRFYNTTKYRRILWRCAQQ